MLEVSLKALITSPLKEVIQSEEYWPIAGSDIADSIDSFLSDRPEQAVIGRAAFLQLCFMWGGCSFHLPDQEKLIKFIDECHLYRLSLLDSKLFEAELNKRHLSKSAIESILQEQQCLSDSGEQEIALDDSQIWKIEVSEIVKQLNESLAELALSLADEKHILSQIFTAMSFIKGSQTLFVPTCKSLEAELRKKLVYRQFNGKNARQLARKYRISLQHTYRLIKAEAGTRKSPL